MPKPHTDAHVRQSRLRATQTGSTATARSPRHVDTTGSEFSRDPPWRKRVPTTQETNSNPVAKPLTPINATMLQTMMTNAQPSQLERLTVIRVMRIRGALAAHFAGLWNNPAQFASLHHCVASFRVQQWIPALAGIPGERWKPQPLPRGALSPKEKLCHATSCLRLIVVRRSSPSRSSIFTENRRRP